MGEKISTIVLKVDLECQRCYKKIRRVLCKIQDEMNIKTISFDEKSNSVTISGPFDAEKVRNKLCCHAGRIIKEMDIKGKESKDGGGDKAAAKPAEKDAGKQEKANKADKEGKVEKDGKADKPAEKKKVTFEGDDAKAVPKADLGPLLEKIKAAKAGQEPPRSEDAKHVKADIGPLLEKIKAAKAGSEPPRGEPIAPPAAAQGMAVPSIWPAPTGSVAGYSYNPSNYDGGYGYGCGCGYAAGYCRCGKPAAPGGYYGVPVYDNQGWYYGGPQPYYPPQQPQQGCEDPNAGCSVM